MNGIEKRKFRRVNIITEVEIISGKETLLAPTRDISVGGVFLRTTARLAENTQVRLRFQIEPKTPLIEATGKLVYVVAGRGLGVEFTEISEEDRSRIEEFVSRLAAEPTLSDELPPI